MEIEKEILERVRKAILEYDAKEAASLAKKAVDEGVSATAVLATMTEAIRVVGEGFRTGEFFLPDMIGAADAMCAATPILEEALSKAGVKRESLGSVVIGTVFGDIHSIGKTMVSTLLTAEGFSVIDLGINVTAEQFIEAVKLHQPNILALSALLTTTATEQKKVIDVLKEEGLRQEVKVMVGGAPITQEFADSIGADGFAPTAPGAATLARKLLNR